MRTALPVLLWIASACQASQPAAPPVSDAQESVDRLALELVDLASRRVDLSTIRAAILPFRRAVSASEPSGASPVAQSARVDVPGVELQREFELALANRLHVVEHAEPGESPWNAVPSANAPPGVAPDSLRSVTHALLGDYAVRDGRLILSVRLVELESRFVLSAAREAVPLTWFSPEARAQLAPSAPTKKGQVVVARPTPSATSTSITSASSVQARVTMPKPRESASSESSRPRSPAPSEAGAPSTIEDFQTWRARRQQLDLPGQQAAPSEPPGGPQETQPARPDAQGKTSSAAQAPRAAPRPAASVQAFPWRGDGWLARLLGIPRRG